MVVREQRGEGKGPGTKYNVQRHDPSDLFTPVRPYVLKFPTSPKTAPPAGIKLSTHEPVGVSHIQTMTVSFFKLET
jgi:hypothetical protein